MKLVASLTSPFARKVRVVLVEKQLSCELLVDIPWNADTRVPEVNPLGKVPVLVRDDGTALYDSRVIVDFLEVIAPEPRLIPERDMARIEVQRWQALADGMADAAAAIFIERRRPVAQQSMDWILRQQGKIAASLNMMARDLGHSRWCCGNEYTLADIAVGAALGYLDFRFSENSWRRDHPQLAELMNQLNQRESFQQTQPVA